MALHPDFPDSPHAILDPDIRWFPADEALWKMSAGKLMPAAQIGNHGYGRNEPPVFFGHYWLTGRPAPIASNLACLNYSVSNAASRALTIYNNRAASNRQQVRQMALFLKGGDE